MTETEQAVAALMIDLARRSVGKKFEGPVSQLKSIIGEQSHGLASDETFFGVLEFWEQRGEAVVHRYDGVEDYVSLKENDVGTRFSFSVNRKKQLGDTDFEPEFPVITTYYDVGRPWLDEFIKRHSSELGRQKDEKIVVGSSPWTGRYNISDESRKEISAIIAKIRDEVEFSELSNAERANVLAIVEAADKLLEAPEPLWDVIIRLLQSPILANITALAALAVSIVKS